MSSGRRTGIGGVSMSSASIHLSERGPSMVFRVRRSRNLEMRTVDFEDCCRPVTDLFDVRGVAGALA